MVQKEVCGKMPDGSDILCFTLSSGPFRAEILSLGGIVRSLVTPDRDGVPADIVLGFDDPLDNTKPGCYFGQIVGRFANRIARGRFSIDGTEYRMECNEGENALHCGRSNYGWRNWGAKEFEWQGNPGVELTLLSPDGDGGMPGDLSVTVTYLLRSDGDLSIEYRAVTNKPTIVNLTNHSFFNLCGAGTDTVLNHVVRLACDRYLEVDGALLPTGKILPVAGTPFDFCEPKPLGRDIREAGGGYDHCFVLPERGKERLREVASVFEPGSGRTMRVCTTLPGLQMYTGNSLDGSAAGKGGVRYRKYGGVCFETQSFPDAPNHMHFPSVVVRPDRPLLADNRFSFGAK